MFNTFSILCIPALLHFPLVHSSFNTSSPVHFSFDTFSDLYEDSDDGKPATSQKPGSLFADETLQLDKRVLARKDRLPKSATARFVGREDNSELFQVRKGYRRKDLKSTLQSLQDGR